MHWYLYILKTGEDKYYTGISTDVERRIAEHRSGSKKAAKSLKGKGPLTLVFSQCVGSRPDALKLEARIKKMPRAAKIDIVNRGQIDIE